MERRRLLHGMGLMGLGWMASTAAADAYTPGGGGPRVKVSRPSQTKPTPPTPAINTTGLPDEWLRAHGAAVREYTHYLNRLHLKVISPAQVVEVHAKRRGATWNTLPPKAWWSRMGHTLRVVDRIALEMNVGQVEVISAYRSPAYNSHCEGAKSGSWHQANVAVDVKFPARASHVTAKARNLRDRGLFKGGVGGYWGFTHIDTRGENINW